MADVAVQGGLSLAYRSDPAEVDRPPAHLSVLCILPTLNPYGGVVSVANMLEHFLDLGHRYTLVSLSRIRADVLHLRSEPVHIEDWDRIGGFMPAGYDVVLATSWETVGPALSYANRHPQAAVFYFVQDFEPDFYSDEATKDRALATYPLIPNRVVKTGHLRRRLAEHGWDAHKITPGMNLDLFYPRDVAPWPRPRVLAMARPGTQNDHRGFGVLSDVMAELARRRRQDPVEIALFGSPALGELNLPFVHADLGVVAPPDLPALYSSADVFVDTSLHHGFGRTGVEAMACGTPCVLSMSGGVDEYAVDGSNALLVPVGDVDATVNAIERMLDEPQLAAQLAAAGRQTVASYDDRLAATQMLSLFEAARHG